MLYVAITAFYQNSFYYTLKNLESQDDQDFITIVIDPGVDEKTKSIVSESRLKGVLYIDYKFPPGARIFDFSQWNSPLLLAESEDDWIYRFQNFRLLPKNGIRVLKSVGANISFIRRPVSISHSEQDWYTSVIVQPEFPHGWLAYNIDGAGGDYCLRVGDLLAINGVDECLTMLNHFDDVDMEIRWKMAASRGLVRGTTKIANFLLYLRDDCRRFPDRIARFNILKKPCQRCWTNYQEFVICNDEFVRTCDLPNNHSIIDIGVKYGKRWIYCCDCEALLVQLGYPHLRINHQGSEVRAPIGILNRYGRDLKKAREKALKMNIPERLRYVADSYTDPEILVSEDV